MAGGIGLGARIALALGLALLLALFLERTTGAAVDALGRWWKAGEWAAVVTGTAAVAAACLALFAAVELLVERFWPQEVYGWAERPALQPDAVLGWRLVPNKSTRLRWMGYDYTVVANDLGFPAPSFPASRPPHTFRIMTLGDAFTSAEGLDTDRSWPRLLQNRLDARAQGAQVQVLNFAVTGYGPQQFDAVAREFVPRYRPDVVIIGFFVKDFGDVLLPGERGAARVGFDLPPLPPWKRVLLMYHARRLLQVEFFEPLDEAITGQPRAEGYALGNIQYFERDREDLTTLAPPLVERRLADIAAIDRRAGARTIVVMIPASVQVCSPNDLPYFPRVLPLENGRRFDLDLPQRETQMIDARLGLTTYDLRQALASLPECPYAAHNMHWTLAGQQAAAAYVGDKLVSAGVLSSARREKGAGNRT
ncbi:MAG: hypothetical protein JO219_01180, partial [Candidatus Eremiobacteraeota bacterium]|nr:hypothetical protein [Candidatus Eremiobacteraeota bacterium]